MSLMLDTVKDGAEQNRIVIKNITMGQQVFKDPQGCVAKKPTLRLEFHLGFGENIVPLRQYGMGIVDESVEKQSLVLTVTGARKIQKVISDIQRPDAKQKEDLKKHKELVQFSKHLHPPKHASYRKHPRIPPISLY